MINGATRGISLDELLQSVARGHAGAPVLDNVQNAPSPATRGRCRRGPDARDRLSADQAHEKAIGVLHLLRWLTRAQQLRVLERAATLIDA